MENQDLLVAVCMRVQDPAHLLRLSAVSKSFKSAADSDAVWRCIILSMFGNDILNIAIESLEKEQLRFQFPLSILNAEHEASQRVSRPGVWTLRSAFASIVLAVTHAFVDCPEHAIGSFTRGLSTEDAGAQAAAYILWCTPGRRGLPDISAPAIRVRTVFPRIGPPVDTCSLAAVPLFLCSVCESITLLRRRRRAVPDRAQGRPRPTPLQGGPQGLRPRRRRRPRRPAPRHAPRLPRPRRHAGRGGPRRPHPLGRCRRVRRTDDFESPGLLTTIYALNTDNIHILAM